VLGFASLDAHLQQSLAIFTLPLSVLGFALLNANLQENFD
jgi:hypothetical protein